jgi:5-oxoprolinase (ATP-hydrolysing)
MTNTGITDPEILENCYPVRLCRFSLRRNSGGRGHYRGGDGLIREFEFLAPLDISLLTQNRTQGAAGMAGGGCGAPGRQILTQPECEPEPLASIASARVQAGAVLKIETPGGGGWGKPENDG